MHTNDSPPGPPDITDNDRSKLRENIRGLCARHGTTQNRLEEDDLQLSRAYLSKMWKGKVRFTHAILLGICRRFNCEALDVVGGTAFTYLLHIAPPSPESDATRQLREERDVALDRAASAEAEVQPLREAAAAAEAAWGIADARAADAEARCAELAAEVRAVAAARDTQMAEAKSAREDAARVRADLTKASARVVAAQSEERRVTAALEQLRRHLEEWKNWATSRDARANFLEQQVRVFEQEYNRVVHSAQLATQRANALAQQTHQLQAANQAEQGAAVGVGLFGLAAGFLLAAAANSGRNA